MARMLYNRDEAITMSNGLGAAPAKLNAKLDEPTPVHDDEILDWDCALETPPPPRRSGRIEVTLRKVQISPSPI